MKDKTTALVLSIILGQLGIDRFYLGYTGIGILKLLTCGCFGILWIIDIINIATGKLKPATGNGYIDEGQEAPKKRASSRATSDPITELEQLSVLYKQGILTDEEFNKMKSDILAQI